MNLTPYLAPRRWIALLALGACVMPFAAQADRDPLIDGARLCTQRFPVEEQRQNIPTHLLAAIATTESGRWHQGLGMSVPWPWTINVEGKGYYYGSKAEAIANTQQFLAQGRRSIDVGCMQVNLKHHPKAFADLNQAFDPATNVAYAAKFLHDNYADLGDWIKATAAYHSRTAVHGNQYLGQIEKSWNRIVSKVSSARATMGASAASQPPAADTGARAAVTMRPLNASTTKRMSLANTPRTAKVIQVREALKPTRSEVIVVHGQPATPVAAAAPALAPQAASSAPAGEEMVQQLGSSIRRVTLDKAASTPLSAPVSTESKFVFAN